MNSKKFAFRAIATLLCLVMLIGMIPVYVAADAEYVVEIGNVTIDTTTTEAVDGYYTVSVPINLTTSAGLMNFSADVTYDEALDLTGWTENGDVFMYIEDVLSYNLSSTIEADLDNNPYRVYISAPTVKKQFYTTGELMALTFKVPANIKAGDYPISIDVVSLLWQDDNQATKPTTEKKSVTTTVAGKVTVIAEEEEEPVDPNAPLAYYSVADLTPAKNGTYKYIVVEDETLPHIRFYAVDGDTLKDNDRVTVGFDNTTLGFQDARYVKIGYRKTGPAAVNFSPILETGRLWDKALSGFVADGGWHEAVIDLKQNYTGGEGAAGAAVKDAADADADFEALKDYHTSGLLLRPWGRNDGGAITGDVYFDIAYIALFNDAAAAEAYTMFETADVVFMNGTEVFATIPFVVGTSLAYPADVPAAPQGKKFVGWDVAEGTVITDAGLTVNAIFEDAAFYVYPASDLTFSWTDAKISTYGVTSTLDEETGYLTISFANAVKIADGDRFSIKLPAGVNAKTFPYIAVGVAGENLPGTQLDWEIVLNDNKRLWGKKWTPAAGATPKKLVFAASAYTSGENGGFDTKPETSTYSRFELRPGVKDQTTVPGQTIRFEYVAFFKTVEEANAFVYSNGGEAPKCKVTFMNGTEIFHEEEVYEGASLVLPTTAPTAPAGKEFRGWNVEAGTTIEEDTIVTAVFKDIIPEDGFIVLDNSEFVVEVADGLVGTWDSTLDRNLETGITTLSINNVSSIGDGSRFYVNFPGTSIKMREYPYMAVGVRAENLPGTKLDWDINTDNGGRMWGVSWAPAIGTEIAKLVIPVSAYTKGGYPDGSYDNANRDDDTYLKFEIRPGTQNNSSTVVGEKIAFEYVAFFKTEAEANAYVFGKDLVSVSFMVDGAEYVKSVFAAGAELVYPETPVVEGKKFTGWDVEEGTIVTDDMVVNAAFVEAVPVAFVADGKTFATISIVEGEELVYPEATPKAANKKFTGWDVEEGTPVTAGMTVNAIFVATEAPVAVVSGRDIKFGFKSDNVYGIFFNGKGTVILDNYAFNANGDEYTEKVFDPEFAYVPATGNWKFVEDVNGWYGADGSQYITAYVNIPAEADILQVKYAVKATAGVYADGITVITDAGDVVVPATYENTGDLTTLVLNLEGLLPEGAKNIRAIKFEPWLRGKNVANRSFFELAYVAAFDADVIDAEAYAPTEEYVAPAQYEVNVNEAENGVVWYNYYTEVEGTVTETYYAGENVYLWVQPAEGYILTGWKNGDEIITPDATVFNWGDRPNNKNYTVDGAVFTVDGALDLTPVFELEVQPVHVAVTATTNGTFAMTTEEFGAADGLTTWDADINPGSEVTFVATADAGYKLDGWYNIADGKNILLSKDATYVLTVGEKDAKIEVRFMDETISIATKLAVETDGNGKVSVAGGEAVENYFDYANGGDNVALTPVANEGYVFAYWTRKSADGTEAFIDAEAEVEVAPLGAEVAYVANFVAEGETATLYVDAQEIVLSKTEEPAVPGRLGYVAGEWKEYVAVENVIVYKPTYVRADTTYTLTITYADGSVDTVEFKYDEGVAVVGKADSSVWTLTVGEGDPIVISYESEFVLGTAFTTDATLVEAENTEEAQAIVNAISAVYDAGANQIKFTATFELPEGATLVERGVLLTSDASVAAEMEIGTAGVIVGKIKKPVDNATKVFIINKSNVAAGATWYGRPYIIYTANGVTETLYATTISATAE